VGAIIVTHAHLDHSALAPTLAKATNAPVLAFGDAASGRSPLMQSLVASGLKGGGEGVDIGFMPDRCLTDGETVDLGALRIEVLHCPGHMGGHLCLGVGKVLLSGDHAMGWASSLISPPDGDMGAYMASLAGLAQRDWTQMLPGHGDAVGDPAARLAELAAHRRLRETQVLQALAPGPADAATLAARIYLDVAPALMPAASRNVLAHLIDLRDRNLVSSAGTLNASVVFKRI
jgi:glyoxylase-like metal-dependent hydrolase (beta-lactamase superfamily II)